MGERFCPGRGVVKTAACCIGETSLPDFIFIEGFAATGAGQWAKVRKWSGILRLAVENKLAKSVTGFFELVSGWDT
jgi:hypothetical protein